MAKPLTKKLIKVLGYVGAVTGFVASILALVSWLTGWGSIFDIWYSEPWKGVPDDAIAWVEPNDFPEKIHFRIPISGGGQPVFIESSFPIPPGKGLLGPRAKSTSAVVFMNSDRSLFGINHQPATKASDVYLYRREQNGSITEMGRANDAIVKLVPQDWKDAASGFSRIEFIEDQMITFQVLDFAGDELLFEANVVANGGFELNAIIIGEWE